MDRQCNAARKEIIGCCEYDRQLSISISSHLDRWISIDKSRFRSNSIVTRLMLILISISSYSILRSVKLILSCGNTSQYEIVLDGILGENPKLSLDLFVRTIYYLTRPIKTNRGLIVDILHDHPLLLTMEE